MTPFCTPPTEKPSVTRQFQVIIYSQVIRSLKKAIQPTVTDTQISYTMPNGVTATSAPDSVPSIFVGERMIAYGILPSSSPLTKTQDGAISLSGDLLGAKIEHNMKFQVPVSVTKESVSQVSTIHHLAAKKLIKEMELNTSTSKNNIMIELSCNSSVICSQTAFIAIDEERKEAVKGSLEIWDILADESVESDDDMGFGLFDDLDISLGSAPKNQLSIIINLQLADGSWEFSKDLADVVGKPTTMIQEACPLPCKGAMYAIWATIIVLSYLKLQQSTFKDEWELVALKAETWIRKQNVPQGCSINVLREKGNAFFS